MNQTWSIIIFGYNEEKTIVSVVEKAVSFIVNNKIEGEILIIDDGSSDHSDQVLREFIYGREKINYIRHEHNLGIGPALLSGYNNAKYENLIAIPADGQFDINELKPFINFPEKTFISFYRRELKDYSNYRKFISRLNGAFNKYFSEN